MTNPPIPPSAARDESASSPSERGTITISHSRAEGTLATGGRKGDGSGDILKAYPQRFTWFRSLGCWGIRNSRDRQADHWKIESAATALRDAGFTVVIEIDEDNARSFAEAETERYERAEDRAERRHGYAENAATRAQALYTAGSDKLHRIPFGQPILIGHHSEQRDRNFREKAAAQIDRSFVESDKAAYHTNRATAAENYRANREDIPRTLRRIADLESDERFWTRTLETGHNSAGWTTDTPEQVAEINRRLTEVREQLTYWRAHIKAAEDAGIKIWSRDDFTKGDFALGHGIWFEVIRVNAKSITVPWVRHWSKVVRADDPNFLWTKTIPYHEISGRRSAAEINAADIE